MSQPSARPRRGFTLVELLVAITIIGMLMSLLTVAVFKVMAAAYENAMLFEISQISAAFESYKEHFGEYPPNMGAVVTTTSAMPVTTRDRASRMVRHFQTIYPRYTIHSPGGGDTYTYNAHFTHTTVIAKYKYRGADGSVRNLNVDTLDPAEALVFWLGGFPDSLTSSSSTATYYHSRKLIGFHIDDSWPCRLDEIAPAAYDMRYRTKPYFDFAENRLVDQDDDGWYEYVPRGASRAPNSNFTPPLVYFDATQYTLMDSRGWDPPFQGYPNQSKTTSGSSVNPNDSTLFQAFGQALPYAKIDATGFISPTTLDAITKTASSGGTGARLQWANPSTFQIIGAGRDGLYCDPPTSLPTNWSVPQRISVFPSGRTFSPLTSNSIPYYPAENDNLTNFYDSRIENATSD